MLIIRLQLMNIILRNMQRGLELLILFGQSFDRIHLLLHLFLQNHNFLIQGF